MTSNEMTNPTSGIKKSKSNQKQHLVRVIRQNKYSHEVNIPMKIIRKLKLTKHDILSCSLKGNKIIYQKVDPALIMM